MSHYFSKHSAQSTSNKNNWMLESSFSEIYLTHLPPGPRFCESSQQWWKWWIVAYSAPSHYLNQYCVVVNWNLSNKLWWNFNWNSEMFIKMRLNKRLDKHSRCRWVETPSRSLLRHCNALLLCSELLIYRGDSCAFISWQRFPHYQQVASFTNMV